MSFVSPEFAIFFCIVVSLYLVTPQRWRWLLLLVASYIFYMSWSVPYAALLLFSSVWNYADARLIARSEADRQRTNWLTIGIVVNLLLLAIFKYFNFFSDSLAYGLNLFHIPYSASHLDLLLPVGISFYTFMGIAYLIDVYRKKFVPETNFGIFASFIAFFPQVVAGPIGRAPALLPQFRKRFSFDEARTVEGLRLILWGAFKKVVIADRLAIYVNQVYDHPQTYHGVPLIVATFFFAFQIYCDFSGYSDIAIGLARILGFKLMDNFKQPYFSLSVTEFWQRWHISLSTWIRDYLFYPIARKSLQITKSRYARISQLLVSIFVMALVGLWHGANWTFVVWGVVHGIFLGVEAMVRAPKNKETSLKTILINTGKIALTFSLVCFAWIFFRANTLPDAGYILTHLFAFQGGFLKDLVSPFGVNARVQFMMALILITSLIAIDVLDRQWGINKLLSDSPLWFRWGLYYGVSMTMLVLAVWGGQEFIYFKF